MTEELWEAGYFDKVQLIAVDHPADVEIYTNEKVGPPRPRRIQDPHGARAAFSAARASDQRGTDLLRVAAVLRWSICQRR